MDKFKKIKDKIYIGFGVFFLLGTIVMITEDIIASLVFMILSIIFFIKGFNISSKINNKHKKIEEKKIELNEDIEQLNIRKTNLTNSTEELSNNISDLVKKKNELDKQLKNRENFFIETELKYIDTLSGLEFENYCCNLLKKNGYVATVTKPTQDSGGDIIASQGNTSYIIQCKNYSDTVGNKAIQEVYTAKGIYRCDKAIVITNNYFTAQAIKEAQILDIELWDRKYLQLLLSVSYHYSINSMNSTN